MAEAKTITVVCGVRSGLMLRTYEERQVEGLPHAIPDREQIELRYGENPGVDARQFEKWLDAHKSEDMVVNGLVFAKPELPAKGMKPLDSAPEAEEEPKKTGGRT